ncbi:hypothetical protein F4801DRAFT_577162 [Xylaria longipes]|nr:hypothetical protein F4801DRAFT_577162 [Xylaria longipes]
MADPLAWLKLGPRSRTPSTPLSTSLPDCKAAREPQPSDPRRPGPSRMSSYVTQSETCLGCLPTDNTDDNAASLFVRNQDRIWYNPSLDQMVKALQVSLMTRDVLEPIPIEYNSYILHLIEGFAKAQSKIRKAEGAYQELQQSLEQNLEQFRLAVNDWRKRESRYQAEVKRLEVLLSKSSPDGLEAVALARTNSVIDRSGTKRRGLLSRLNELKMDHFDGSSSPSAPLAPTTPKILDNDNDFFISQKFRKQDAATKVSMTVSRERPADRYDAANKASTTGPGERPTFWNGEALETGSNGTKSGQDGLRNLLAAPTNRRRHGPLEAQSPTQTQQRDEALIGLSNGGTRYRPGNTSNIPTITKPDEVLMAGAASRHERHNSGFSFEPGDDCVRLLGNSVEEYGESDTGSNEETPSSPSYLAHPTLENVANEKCRRRGKVNGLINGLMSGKERRQSRDNDGSAIHHPLSEPTTVVQSPACKPVRRSRDSGGSKKTAIKDSPSQSSHSHDSPIAASHGGQETPQRQQTETDARIAAALALANALGSTNLKK